jgi:pimeloyl-ACP methyl ester carboxylesterase
MPSEAKIASKLSVNFASRSRSRNLNCPSFQLYRAFPTTKAQNEQRKTRRLTLPVLAIGGAESSGQMVADTMKLTADDVQSLVIPGCGHWLAEQAPEEMLAALTAFLAPYWDGR